MVSSLKQYINQSPTAYHAVANIVARLKKDGYVPFEGTAVAGGKYYSVKNGSSLAAFRIPKKAKGFVIAASHSDSPCFRIRDHAEREGEYLRLSIERYGGLIHATWFDRPLGIAGRVMVRSKEGVEMRLIDFGTMAAILPNVAIHFNRDMNEKLTYDPATDMVALFADGDNKGSFYKTVAKLAHCKEENVLASDLCLYNKEESFVWGPKEEFFSAPRIDDLACAFANTESFFAAQEKNMVPVLWISDNEEMGSATKQGGGSCWFPDLLREVCAAMQWNHSQMLNNSWLLSCDNAHAKHPNHPELSDPKEAPVLNGGVVIKHSPKYTTDAVSSALFQEVCRKGKVPVQHFSNRPDKAGGGTLGLIASTKLPVNAVDIGIPQLAMHSSLETMGTKDLAWMIKAVQACFEANVTFSTDHIVIE